MKRRNHWLDVALGRRTASGSRHRGWPCRTSLRLEILEDRTAPSATATLNVTSGALTYTVANPVSTPDSLSASIVSTNYQFAAAAGDTITLTQGAISAGWTTSPSNVAIGPVSSVTGSITITMANTTNTVTLNLPAPLSTTGITVNGGSMANTFDIETTPKSTTTVNGGSGSNVFNVSSAPNLTGNLAGLGGPVSIAGGAGTNQLNVSEMGSTTADTLTVASNQISGTGFSIQYASPAGFANGANVDTSATVGATVNIQSTLANSPTTVTGGSGNNVFNVPSTANLVTSATVPLTINGGSGTQDQLNVTDPTAGDTLTVTKAQISGKSFTINYGASFGKGLNVNAASGSTITVASTPTSSPTTITGAGSNVFVVSSTAGLGSPLTITAGSGANQLSVTDPTAADTVMVTNAQITGKSFTIFYGTSFSSGLNVSVASSSTITVASTPTNSPTTITGADSNVFNVSSTANLGSPLTITAGTGANQLTVSDPSTGDTVMVTTTQITGKSFTINYGTSFPSGLNVNVASGSTITVASTPTNSPTTIAGAGSNVFDVTSTAGLGSPLTVSAGSGANELTVADPTTGDTVMVTNTQITGKSFTIHYGTSFSSGLNVNVASGATITVASTPTNSPTTITGAGSNVFDVSSTANLGSPLTITAGSGANQLTVADPTTGDTVMVTNAQITGKSFTIHYGTSFSSGLNVNVASGSTITVASTPTNSPTTITGAGSNVFDVSSTANLGSPLTITAGTGANQLTVTDPTTGDTVMVTNTQITGKSFTINYGTSFLSGLNVSVAFGSKITIAGTPANSPTTITGADLNVFDVSSTASLGSPLTIIAASAANFLTVTDPTTADTVMVTSTQITGKTFTINYGTSFSSGLNVNVASGSTITVASTPTNSPTTITGAGSNVFDATSTANLGSPLTITAGSGANELTVTDPTTGDIVLVTNAQITGKSFTINYGPSFSSGLNVSVASGSTINVASTPASSPTTITGAGSNVFDVSSAANLGSPLTIAAGTGPNQLNVIDSATGDTVLVTKAQITGKSFVINYGPSFGNGLNVGVASGSTITVQSTTANTPTTATGAGNDVFDVSSAPPGPGSDLAELASPLTIVGGTGMSQLNVSDIGSMANDTLTVTNSAIFGTSMTVPFTINYTNSGTWSSASGPGIVVLLGQGADTANLLSTPANTNQVFVQGGSGADIFNVSSAPVGPGSNLAGLAKPLTIDAGTNPLNISPAAETSQLNVSDIGSMANDTLSVTSSAIFGTSMTMPFTINYMNSGIWSSGSAPGIVVLLGQGTDTTNVLSTPANTNQVFVQGGSGANVFNVSSAPPGPGSNLAGLAKPLTIDAGTNPLNISSAAETSQLNVSDIGSMANDTLSVTSSAIFGTSMTMPFSINYGNSGRWSSGSAPGIVVLVGQGADTTNVLSTPANTNQVFVQGGSGTDVFNVSSAPVGPGSNLAGLAKPLTIDAGTNPLNISGASETSQLNVSDLGSMANDTLNVTSAAIFGTSMTMPFTINYSNSGTWSSGSGPGIVVLLGQGTETANVLSTPANTNQVFVQGGANVDVYNVSSAAPSLAGNLAGLARPLTIDAGTNPLNVPGVKVSQLNVGDAGSSGSEAFTVSSNQISGSNLVSPLDQPFTINYSNAGTWASAANPSLGGGGVNVVAGSANNTLNIESTPSDVDQVVVSAGGGSDTFNVSSAANLSGNLAQLPRPVTVAAGTGTNHLNLSDSGNTGPDAATITNNAIMGNSSGSSFLVNYTGTFGNTMNGGVTFDTSNGNDLVIAQSLLPNTTTTVNGGAGSDVFDASSTGGALNGTFAGFANSTLDVNAGANTNQLNASEAGSGASDTLMITNAQFMSTAANFALNYTAQGTLNATLMAPSFGGNTLDVASTRGANSTTTLDTGPNNGPTNSTVNLGGDTTAGALNNIQGTLNINGVAGPTPAPVTSCTLNPAANPGVTLNAFDESNGTRVTYTVTAGTLSTSLTGTVNYNQIANVNLYPGTAANTINMNGETTNGAYFVKGGPGGENFNVRINTPSPPSYNLITLVSGSGNDNLVFPDLNPAVDHFDASTGMVTYIPTGRILVCFSTDPFHFPQAGFSATATLLTSSDGTPLANAQGLPQFQIALTSQLSGTVHINVPLLPAFIAAPTGGAPAGYSAPSIAIGDIAPDMAPHVTGIPDLIVGLGAGYDPVVTVLDVSSLFGLPFSSPPTLPATNAVTVVAQFYAYASLFRGGVNVAVGNVFTAAGTQEIITAPGPETVSPGTPNTPPPPQVEVWDYDVASFNAQIFPSGGVVEDGSFNPYPGFTGAVRVAAGNVDGSGIDQVITAPGPGGSPLVEAFKLTQLQAPAGPLSPGVISASMDRSFMAYDPSFTGGVYVAAGNFRGAQGVAYDDILTGPGPGVVPDSAGPDFGGDIKVFDGENPGLPLVARFSAFLPPLSGGSSTSPSNSNWTNGVNGVAFAFFSSTYLDILVGAGAGQEARTVVYDGQSVLAGAPALAAGQPPLQSANTVTVDLVDSLGNILPATAVLPNTGNLNSDLRALAPGADQALLIDGFMAEISNGVLDLSIDGGTTFHEAAFDSFDDLYILLGTQWETLTPPSTAPEPPEPISFLPAVNTGIEDNPLAGGVSVGGSAVVP